MYLMLIEGALTLNQNNRSGIRASLTNKSTVPQIYYFFSSFILLTLLDRHLGQARSIKGALGSKGILNSCPHLKHLKVASSAIISPI